VRLWAELEPVFSELVGALRACERTGAPLFSCGERIVANARRFSRTPEQRARFARAAQLRSVNPAIAPLGEGATKALLFVGDALYAAGFEVPMDEGCYLPVALWPRDRFQPIEGHRVRPGDLLVSGPHVEVIMRVLPAVVTLGARAGGLVEDEEHGLRLARARSSTIYVLRVTVQGPRAGAE
jgi:hypothetical protein